MKRTEETREMPKLEIVEIENSYLNFFTPAIIIALGLFLDMMLGKPFILATWFLEQSIRTGIYLEVSSALDISFSIFRVIIASLVVFYIFIPKLKVLDAEYHPPKVRSLLYVVPVFCIIILVRNTIGFIYELVGNTVPWRFFGFYGSFEKFHHDPTFFVLSLIYIFLIHPIFLELFYRRTVIPALEDRGLSPLHAVLLSSFGFGIAFLPSYFLAENLIGTMFWFVSTFLYGLGTGIIYILTRNILFSGLYTVMYFGYRYFGEMGQLGQEPTLLTIRFIIDIVVLVVGIMILIVVIVRLLETKSSQNWVKIFKTPSVPKIERGVIGFLILTLVLVITEMTINNAIDTITEGNFFLTILLNLIFYTLAFTIPFWLTITSEFTLS